LKALNRWRFASLLRANSSAGIAVFELGEIADTFKDWLGDAGATYDVCEITARRRPANWRAAFSSWGGALFGQRQIPRQQTIESFHGIVRSA
jgi:hypothetical protein